MTVCLICGEHFNPCKPTSTTCSRKCANTLVARRSAKARGDKQRNRGEGKTYRKRDGRHEHRVVAEEQLGRPLLPGEVVHHKDNDRRNNDPSNLVVLSGQGEHARLHGTKGRTCDVETCERKHYAKGLCGMHYQRSQSEAR